MRLIVVDDDRLVVDSLKIILGAQPQIEVVGTGAWAGSEGSAERLDALAHGAEPHAFRDSANARPDPALAIVGNDELVKRRMLHASHGDVLGVSVAHGVGERLAQDRSKAVDDVGWCMLGQNLKLNLRAAVRARVLNDAFELHGEIGRVVVECMDARAHKLKSLVDRVLDVGEIGSDTGFVGVDHA